MNDPSGRLWNKSAYADWKDFARQRGREPGSQESFGHKLKEHLGGETTPGKDALGKSARYRNGWRLVKLSDRAAEVLNDAAHPPTEVAPTPAPKVLH